MAVKNRKKALKFCFHVGSARLILTKVIRKLVKMLLIQSSQEGNSYRQNYRKNKKNKINLYFLRQTFQFLQFLFVYGIVSMSKSESHRLKSV